MTAQAHFTEGHNKHGSPVRTQRIVADRICRPMTGDRTATAAADVVAPVAMHISWPGAMFSFLSMTSDAHADADPASATAVTNAAPPSASAVLIRFPDIAALLPGHCPFCRVRRKGMSGSYPHGRPSTACFLPNSRPDRSHSGTAGGTGQGQPVRVRWIREFIWPARRGSAMDTRTHTRFPRWVRVSIARSGPAGRDRSGNPSQARRTTGPSRPQPSQARAVTAAAHEPNQAAPSTAQPTPPADQRIPNRLCKILGPKGNQIIGTGKADAGREACARHTTSAWQKVATPGRCCKHGCSCRA